MSNASPRPTASTAWVGWIVCAAAFMMLAGVLGAIEGLVAIFNDDYYADVGGRLVIFNMTTWGVIHLVLGVGLVAVGYALLKGSQWATIAAAAVLGLNIISTFLFASAYPAWAFMLIAINGFTLWAILVHGREVTAPD